MPHSSARVNHVSMENIFTYLNSMYASVISQFLECIVTIGVTLGMYFWSGLQSPMSTFNISAMALRGKKKNLEHIGAPNHFQKSTLLIVTLCH